MDPLGIEESVDVLEDAEPCLGDVVEGFELRPLVLERSAMTALSWQQPVRLIEQVMFGVFSVC